MSVVMKALKAYTIQFVGLKVGEHSFDYHIDQTFFNNFEYEEFNEADVKVDLKLIKKTTLLEFHILALETKICDIWTKICTNILLF